MKTRKEVLEEIVKKGNCIDIMCEECPYNSPSSCAIRLRKVGAMAILRQNRKKEKLDPNKILTCVTADKAKVGMKGYFADNLENMKFQFATKRFQTLHRINSERNCARLVDNLGRYWYLFYPIDEGE